MSRGLDFSPNVGIVMAMKNLETIVTLLGMTPACEHNELLVECLPSVPNVATKDVELRFSGWNIKLHPDGTYSVTDTGGLLQK